MDSIKSGVTALNQVASQGFSTKELLLAQAALNAHPAGDAFWETLEGKGALYVCMRAGLKAWLLRSI